MGVGHRRRHISRYGLDAVMHEADLETTPEYQPKPKGPIVPFDGSCCDPVLLDKYLRDPRVPASERVNALTDYAQYVKDNPALAAEFKNSIFRRLRYIQEASDKTEHLHVMDGVIQHAQYLHMRGSQNDYTVN